MSTSEYDVIVVGSGFAGLTAARELAHSGRRVVVLEARDRIGGRTWLDQRMGLPLELGGTWVHWVQPHVWSELRRYGIGLSPSPAPENAYWWDGERAAVGTPSALLELLDRPNELLAARSRNVFPHPFAPLDSEMARSVDEVSLLDHLDRLPLSATERALLESFWTLNFNGRLDDAAYTQALRWIALANGDWKVMFEACATYKIAGGTAALLEAIRRDTAAEFVFGADIRSVSASPEGASVETSDGRSWDAPDVIVTVPLHALHRVSFTPALPPAVADATAAGQLGLGTKIWFTIAGEQRPFVALGAADWPLNFFQSEYAKDGTTFVIGFGRDASVIAPDDRSAIQEILRRLVPDVEVLDSAGHDWVADDFAQETWPMHRRGFLSRSLPALRAGHGAVRFAGSDVAEGWGGFIDGAIESGLTAARDVLSRIDAPREALAATT
ncbi:NAD(P)/FAD-dependent oxidoreductase [Microbacterium sp.]|uniref:flavin monoamine oxidase family protein n=1 Tax=Microbacterium sp. TaxID=51671 RepID=UPI0025D1B818|nr:NAD(P)/FAD-dependent oxidoreductase [Microbacterium sp.]